MENSSSYIYWRVGFNGGSNFSFLSKTSNELGTELESLKMIFEMKKELFYKSTIKGVLAEDEIAEFLNNFFTSKRK